jgi:hypothetical protein
MKTFSNRLSLKQSLRPSLDDTQGHVDRMRQMIDQVRSRAIALILVPTLVLALGAGSTAVAAAKDTMRDLKFKEFPLEISRGDRLIVQGLRGTVRLIPTAPGKPAVLRARKSVVDINKPGAKAHFDSLSFSVRREGGVVMIEPKGPTSRQDWIEWSQPGQPDLSFEIECPSTSAEIHLHSGSVFANGWKDAVSVSLQDGKVTTSDGEGAFRATILRGDIKIEKQKGLISIESHAANVSVANSEGDVQVHNFAGASSVNGIKGDVSLRSKAGTANIAKVDGGLEFDNGRGRLEGTAIDGVVRGVNDDGTVSIGLTGEADLSIETQDGPVAVKPPGGAGVLLKLSSEDGGIVAPDSVNVPKVSGPKSVVARLSGVPKGVIVVRAKRGTIRVR